MNAIDLFCGRGGWTDGLMAEGFEVWGFDINPQPEYKGHFVQCDILTLTVDDLRAYKPDFAVCSSPCEQFSVHTMKHFHPNPPFPEMGLRLWNHAKMLLECLGVPYVMENVRGAEKFVGKCVNHCGPFYLWGTGIPAVMPKDAFKARKGVAMGSGGDTHGLSSTEKHAYRKRFSMMQTGSKSKERQEFTAAAATIPVPIASAVAQLARNHVEASQ